MKVLRIDADFLLPDDFNGTLAEALREFAKYHESEQARDKRKLEDAPGHKNEKLEKYLEVRWSEFFSALTEGKRAVIDFSVSYFDGKKWNDYEI